MLLLLLASEALPIPEGNLGKALALLLLLAMILQPIVARRFAKGVTENQTADLAKMTGVQTELIVGSLEDVRHEVKRVREAQEKAEVLNSTNRTAIADHAVRLGEYKRRLDAGEKRMDNHDVQLMDHQIQLVDLREAVEKVRKA